VQPFEPVHSYADMERFNLTATSSTSDRNSHDLFKDVAAGSGILPMWYSSEVVRDPSDSELRLALMTTTSSLLLQLGFCCERPALCPEALGSDSMMECSELRRIETASALVSNDASLLRPRPMLVCLQTSMITAVT
jgi:hypothetical protein